MAENMETTKSPYCKDYLADGSKFNISSEISQGFEKTSCGLRGELMFLS